MYHVPLTYAANSSEPIISVAEVKTLFCGNVEVIFNISKELLGHIEQRIPMWSPNQKIADIFVRMFPFFKGYFDYSKGFEASHSLMAQLNKTNPKFTKFLEERKNIVVSQRLDLPSLLIMPIQRLPRYILLLEDLKKHTKEDHPDSTELVTAITTIKKIVADMNDTIKKAENTQKIIEIQSKFPHDNLDHLLTPHRSYVRDAPITRQNASKRKKKPGFLFLFNDLVILAKSNSLLSQINVMNVKGFANLTSSLPTGPETFKVIEEISLVNAIVISLSETQEKSAFSITGVKKNYIIMCKSAEEKSSWLQGLNTAKQDIQKRDEKILKMLNQKQVLRGSMG